MDEEDTLSKLERLRFKPRTELKEGLVRAVLLQPLEESEKIRKIELIDLISDDEASPEPSRRSRGPLVRPPKAPEPTASPDAPASPPVVDPELSEPRRVESFRRRLSRPPKVGGWWAYLTREYGPIVRFGARTSILGRGFFPFTLKLSSEALTFLAKTLPQQTLPVLDQTLTLVARKSWLHLTKYEYNLLAALRELVRLVAAVSVAEEDRSGGGAAWDPVFPALRLFWTTPELVDRTMKTWDLATLKLGCSEGVRQGGLESIRTLLEVRTDTTSLPEVLQGLQILRSRRMVTWDEEGPAEPGEYFLKDAFDCTPEVQAEIDKAAAILEEQLGILAREAQEIRRIRYFLPPENLLTDFDGGAEREDKALWCQGFLVRLDHSFAPFLEGTVTFADGTQTVLFQNPSLASTLARLRLVEAQLTDPVQRADPELVTSAARMVMNLGKTLVVLIRNRSLTADPLARSPDSTHLTDPLPFEEAIVDRPAAWAGLSVIDTLVKMTRICLQAGRFLGETSLETSLEKESSLPGRAADLLTRIGRLIPAARLEGLKSRWVGQFSDSENH